MPHDAQLLTHLARGNTLADRAHEGVYDCNAAGSQPFGSELGLQRDNLTDGKFLQGAGSAIDRNGGGIVIMNFQTIDANTCESSDRAMDAESLADLGNRCACSANATAPFFGSLGGSGTTDTPLPSRRTRAAHTAWFATTYIDAWTTRRKSEQREDCKRKYKEGFPPL